MGKLKMDKDKIDSAVALEYDGINTPKITALGQNEFAKEIVELALQCNVPLYENPELARLLSQLDVGEDIPESLFHAVAHVIAFVYHLQGKVPGYKGAPNQ